MFFTREDILKIQNALLQLSVKDSELPSAEPVTYDDTLSIVQDGKNKQIKIEDFFNQISLWKREDFINITDKYDEHYISLIEAINLIPILQRKDGLVITFQDIEGNWEIYQFRGNITEFFNIEKWFNLYDYRNNIIQSIVPDEEDLTASIPNENGNSLVSLKDRVYDPISFSGKGYKILRKNIQSVNIAVTKIKVEFSPSSDGTLSFSINGKETQVSVSVSTDNTTVLVADKIATKLTETMTEYEVSKDASTITLTRKFGGSVTQSVFSASTTGVVCTITDSTKREFRNILTPVMINQPNTIYEIRYDFDLKGKTLEMPENCTLKFKGGSLSNGTIYANKTNIINSNNSINCVLTGTVNNKIIYSDIVCSLELLNIDFNGKKIIFVKDETIRKPLLLHNVNNCVINGNLHKITNIGCNVVQLDGLFSRIEIFNIIADGQETENSLLVGNNSSDGIKEYISIHDNYIFNQQVGISLNADLAGDYRFSEIYNNYLENIVGTDPGHGYGIHLANVQFSSIHDNTIKRAMRHSIYHAWGHDNKIYNNKIIEHRYGITDGVPRASLAIFRNSYNLNIYYNEFINCISTNIHMEQSGDSNSDRDKIKYGNQHDIIIEHNRFYYDLNIDYRSIMLGYNVLPNYSDYNYEIENVIIKENIFEIKNSIAIENYCCKNLIIDSNHFILSKTAYAIAFPSKYLNQYSSNTTVLNNIIECTELDRINTAIYVSFDNFIQNHTYNIFGNKILNSRVDEHHYFKLLPDNFINNYHTQNNNIQEYRNSKPTEGYYVSGDIIYTYSFKKQLAFVCVESGTPGVWWPVLKGMMDSQYADINSPETVTIPNGQRFNCGRRMVIGTNDGYVDSVGNSFYFNTYGNLEDAPTTAYNGTRLSDGSTYYAIDIQKPLWWYVNKWVDANGNDISNPTKGTTAQRPASVNEGYEYYDTTLKKKILWNGSAWVNLDGTELTASTSSKHSAENPS